MFWYQGTTERRIRGLVETSIWQDFVGRPRVPSLCWPLCQGINCKSSLSLEPFASCVGMIYQICQVLVMLTLIWWVQFVLTGWRCILQRLRRISQETLWARFQPQRLGGQSLFRQHCSGSGSFRCCYCGCGRCLKLLLRDPKEDEVKRSQKQNNYLIFCIKETINHL